MAVVFGVIALITGLFALTFACGAFCLRPWVWTIGLWTHVAIVLWSLLAVLGPARLAERWVTLAVSGVVLYHRFTPAIRRG